MIYRAVGDRVAIDVSELERYAHQKDIILLLRQKGFEKVEVNLNEIARSAVGKKIAYRRGARMRESPDVFDCSSFTKWLYGQKGIWIPRRSIQQQAFGKLIGLSDLQPSDLLFKSGPTNYYEFNPDYGIGHVGIFTECETVIHAVNGYPAVVETPLKNFINQNGEYRGAARIISNPETTITLTFDPRLELETSDDAKWLLLTRLNNMV